MPPQDVLEWIWQRQVACPNFSNLWHTIIENLLSSALFILSVINVHAPRQWLLIFSTISNADGQVIMMVILWQFLATSARASYTYRTGILLPSGDRILYVFSQEIYLMNFFRQAAQSPLFSPQKAMHFIMLYFWFIKYSHFKKWSSKI